MAVIVIRYETTATTRWTSPFIIRAFFNDTITVTVWTRFHVRLVGMIPHPNSIRLCDHCGRVVGRQRMRCATVPLATQIYWAKQLSVVMNQNNPFLPV
jgi:hypothetical protein